VQNVVTYDVVVGVDNSDLALKPGMTAATRIVIDQRDDVIRVPSQALRFSPGGGSAATQGQPQVWVLRDGQPVAVPVTTGLDDDSFTEIVKGELKPDDRVIVAEQRSADSSATPRPRF
jgi:HlyD family secretion protein